MAIVVVEDDLEWGTSVRVRITDEDFCYFSGFDYDSAIRRGLVFRALYERTGCKILRRDAIPTTVTCSGRPMVAAYLFAVHHESVDNVANVAERLEVSPSTVEQYLSDVRHGRR